MGKILFTGDLHFGHENVLAFDNRPFATVDEMDFALFFAIINMWKFPVTFRPNGDIDK